MDNILKSKWLWAAIIFVLAYWKRGCYGEIGIDKTYFMAAIAIFLLFFSDLQYKAWKYDSPQLITPNEHGSTDMRITPAGDGIVLIRKGGILTGGWHSSGGDGTYVLPSRYVYIGDNTIISSVVVEETDMYELPPPVFDMISQNKEFKPPFLFGRIPLEAMVGTISCGENEKEEIIENLIQREKMLSRQINWLRKRLQEATLEIDNLMSHYRRATKEDKWYEALVKKEDGSE